MSEIQQSTFLLNIFPVIILRWFPVKPQVLLMHTNSAIIYRHVRDHWDTRMLPFFLKYSTCFKDSRSGRRVHTYFSVHSSHHHLLNRHAANCIECTSNSSFFFFPTISVTGKIFTCISCIWDLSVYHISSFPDPHSPVTEKQNQIKTVLDSIRVR